VCRRGFGLLALIDLVAVDGAGARGFNPQAHLGAVHAEDGDADVVADVQGLIRAASENEHFDLRVRCSDGATSGAPDRRHRGLLRT